MCSSAGIHYAAKIKQQQNERGKKGNGKKRIDSALIVFNLVQFGLLSCGVKWSNLFSMKGNPISLTSQCYSPRLFSKLASSVSSFEDQQERHLSGSLNYLVA